MYFYRHRRMVAYWWFDRAIRGIHDTPPIRVVDAPWTIVSMVAPKHIAMYLLSIKAFYRRVGRGKVVAIIDRDMPQETRDTLRRHVQGIEFQVLEDIDVGPCQRGGTWERILWILDRARDEYVVQIDADVLAVAPDVNEVLRCMEEGTAFTMADAHQIMSMREAALYARSIDGDYIGEVSERMFDRYPGHEALRYVRGSSGLAGFAPGGFSREGLYRFHEKMEALVGPKRWREWGTEQCASNFAVANTAGAVVLPYPAYASFHPHGPRGETKCFHFIGSYRFDEGFFAAHGRREIAALNARPTPPRPGLAGRRLEEPGTAAP
ncbi:hypothetical protein SAMN02745194_03725 [Roseomonas rosea]|uniref:Uncharacterized protein n=1 Tax=Muricoccus roseus TaxID=198092 RepID=A0A1M6N8L8_9PROT|nr:hypothetical protein [Roseomonas rosea]SHJ91984.1 hypothetical protein SAMN02745194_03725 [Roseomonas rosea]